MRARRWLRGLTVLCLFTVFFQMSSVAMAARLEPLYTPLPIDVGRGFTRSEIREAVSDSLINSGWHAQKAQGGQIRAFQAKGRYMARLGIRYSGKIIRFQYLGSERMNARTIDGVEHIYGLYNTWVHDFENALKFRINQLARSHEHGLKAPVREVKVRSRQRKKVIIKRSTERTAPDSSITTVEPASSPNKPPQGAVVHDVIVKPETHENKVRMIKEPIQPAPKRDVEIKTVETPTTANAASDELPPADSRPAKPAQSKDLGELKW